MKLERELIQPLPLQTKKASFWRIGHRGFPSIAPENTLISFEKALEQGVDMIEFDVALSKDKIPIVLHDPTLNRTTNGKGKVKSKTLNEIKTLDAGVWFNPTFEGEEIPTLSEVLQWSQGKISLNIEIKSEASSFRQKYGVEEKVVELVNDFRMSDFCVLSSFSKRVVERLKKIAPKQSVALLVGGRTIRTDFRRTLQKLGVDALHINKERVTEKLVRDLKKEGYPVRVYTVNDIDLARKLINQGVDGIYSDRADLLKSI